MNCEKAFRIIVLIALLTGIVSCQEAEQKMSTPVVPETPIAAEPTKAPTKAPEVERVVAAEAPEDDLSAQQAGEVEETGPEEEVLVSYSDKRLTMRDIEYLQPNADAGIIKRIADWWLTTQLLADEAMKRGLDRDPAISLRASLRAKQEYAEGLKKHVRDAVQIGEDQLGNYYEENKVSDRQINEPAKVNFTHVASNTLEEAQAILDRVKAGEDIGALAKELSVDYDKRKGGAVRNMMETNIDRRFGTEFLNAILFASEGDIIGPIKATLSMGKGERYEVVRFEGKVAGRIKSFDEVKDYIKTRVERAEKEKAVQDLLKSLEENAGEIYRSEQILKEETPARGAPRERIRMSR